MQDRILIDAGPLIALFHTGDNHHKRIRDFFIGKEYLFISTLAVFTEVSYFLSVNINAVRDFYEWVMHKGVILSDINQNDIPRIMDLTNKYADLPMDFADATLIITAEKTNIREIISLDKDFDVYRLPGKERIHNVYKPD
ncbi:MAG: PIN domain-containing protein [Leptospirales bacterium]|nr:PIN domain-containing protein [Leptospirales bacterium]